MTATEERCAECGGPRESSLDPMEQAFACDACEAPICCDCATALMVGDESTQYVYCSTCVRDGEGERTSPPSAAAPASALPPPSGAAPRS